MKKIFLETMKNIKASYGSMLAKFAQKGKKGESVNHDVRFAPVDGNQNRGDHELPGVVAFLSTEMLQSGAMEDSYIGR